MKNLIIYFLFITAIVALFGFAFSYAQTEGLDGQQVFTENKCLKCHSVESLQLETTGKKPVDLSEIGGKFENDFLAKYLHKEEMINDKKHKIEFKGTEEELTLLINWLQTLKAEATE